MTPDEFEPWFSVYLQCSVEPSTALPDDIVSLGFLIIIMMMIMVDHCLICGSPTSHIGDCETRTYDQLHTSGDLVHCIKATSHFSMYSLFFL